MKIQLSVLMFSLGLVASSANAELINNSTTPSVTSSVSTSSSIASFASMPVSDLQAAAKAGSAPAQFFLATRYKTGQGISMNLVEAFNWYKKAADQGIAAAQLNVGQMYAEGRGVKQDMILAKQWLQKAARQGDNRASYNLALIEERNQNLSSAYQWYDLASRDGMLDKNVSQQAQGKILKLAANLSPQDIQAARDRADRWFQDDSSNR